MSLGRPQEPSIRLRRILALVIDVMPLYLVSVLPPVSHTAGYYGAIPLIALYRVALALGGQDTIGKRTLRLAVTNRDGTSPGRRIRLLREAPYLALLVITGLMTLVTRSGSVSEQVIPAFILLGVIDFAFWDVVVLVVTGSSSIHDLLGRTRVASLSTASASG